LHVDGALGDESHLQFVPPGHIADDRIIRVITGLATPLANETTVARSSDIR